jgi:primase-polymerase (primpol)-like protein
MRPKPKKVPKCAAVFDRNASVIDPDTWTSFEQTQAAYEQGGFSGVGIVLNGDGLVGIDLDNCVIDGVPSEQAMSILDSIGCQYVELSPSGKGLRSFGYVDNPPLERATGEFNGVNVELYSRGRYLTVTGHALRAGPIAQLPSYVQVHSQIRTSKLTEESEVTEGTKVTQDTDFSSSVWVTQGLNAERFPANTIPEGYGVRNFRIFDLAQHLRGLHPNADVESMKGEVMQWFNTVLPAIRTKDFTESWLAFKRCWKTIKYPKGIWGKVIAGLDPEPAENEGSALGLYGARLYQLCVALQAHQGETPFMLPCRKAGEAIGISHEYANDLLNEFCAIGILELKSKGTTGKASRYVLKHSPYA